MDCDFNMIMFRLGVLFVILDQGWLNLDFWLWGNQSLTNGVQTAQYLLTSRIILWPRHSQPLYWCVMHIFCFMTKMQKMKIIFYLFFKVHTVTVFLLEYEYWDIVDNDNICLSPKNHVILASGIWDPLPQSSGFGDFQNVLSM